MNLDYKDIIVLITIIIIIIIFIYFFIIFNNKTEEKVIIYKEPINKIIFKFSNDEYAKQFPNNSNDKIYINDVIPQKINNNIKYEYAKQFPENISIPINPNSVGFCPDAKEEKSALPFANINVNVLLANSNSQL